MYKIIKSKISNQGLVATRDIRKNIKIMDYKGRLISKKETENNEKKKQRRQEQVPLPAKLRCRALSASKRCKSKAKEL